MKYIKSVDGNEPAPPAYIFGDPGVIPHAFADADLAGKPLLDSFIDHCIKFQPSGRSFSGWIHLWKYQRRP